MLISPFLHQFSHRISWTVTIPDRSEWKSSVLNFWYDFPTADAALDRPSNQQQCTGSKGRGRNDFLWRTQRISHRKPYAGIAKKGGFLKRFLELTWNVLLNTDLSSIIMHGVELFRFVRKFKVVVKGTKTSWKAGVFSRNGSIKSGIFSFFQCLKQKKTSTRFCAILPK